MIKKKGDKSVEEWEHHHSGFSTQIYLRGTRFVATLLEREFEVWQQCENIAHAIFDLRKQLRSMISTNEGIQNFLSIGLGATSSIQIEDKKRKS